MKKILLTGFEPFGGESMNPSWLAVERLAGEIGGYSVSKLLIPVAFSTAAEMVIAEARRIKPDVILCIGQAGGREAITPELVALNLRYASIPDNAGNQPMDEKVVDGGENALFATVPVRRMAEAINATGASSSVSYSAGAYVCNDLMYSLLTEFCSGSTRVGFIHVPYCTEMGKEPSMELADIVRGLTAAIECLD